MAGNSPAISDMSSEVSGRRKTIVDRDIFELVEMESINRHPDDARSLRAEERLRRNSLRRKEIGACNEFRAVNKNHPAVLTEGFKDAHGAWTGWQNCLYNHTNTLTESEFMKMIGQMRNWLNRMREIKDHHIVTPTFKLHKLQL